MALENVSNFINLVREAPEVRIEVEKIQKEVAEQYKDRMPTEEERRALIEKYIIPIADSVGSEFTADELDIFINGRKDVVQRELSLDELEMVGAGKTFCMITGFSREEKEDGSGGTSTGFISDSGF
jgi:hypothetical protein